MFHVEEYDAIGNLLGIATADSDSEEAKADMEKYGISVSDLGYAEFDTEEQADAWAKINCQWYVVS